MSLLAQCAPNAFVVCILTFLVGSSFCFSSGQAVGTAFVYTLNATGNNGQYCIQITDAYVVVNWGDGSTAEVLNSTTGFCHTYVSNGTYTISIDRDTSDGARTQWANQISYLRTTNFELLGVSTFGDLGLTALSYFAQDTDYAFYVPRVLPPSVTSLSGLFYRAHGFNSPNVTYWDTSSVTSFYRLFAQCYYFDQPVGTWNTSLVTEFSKMFDTANAFNQPLNDWNTSSATGMRNMFEDAYAFNQPISKWDTSKVTSFYQMFQYARSFNQYIDNWDVSRVTVMDYTFNGADAFNQNLTAWCVTLIPAAPTSFNSSGGNWTLLPVWGSCPPPRPPPPPPPVAPPVAPPAAPPVAAPAAAPVAAPIAAPVATPVSAPSAAPAAGAPVAAPQTVVAPTSNSTTPTASTKTPSAPTAVGASSGLFSAVYVASALIASFLAVAAL